MKVRLCWFVLGVVSAVAWVPAQESPPPEAVANLFPPGARSGMPDGAAQKSARKQVENIYGQEIGKTKTKEGRAALARRLLQAGIDEVKDRAARYVLLGLAMDIAVEGGESETALAAADEQAGSFEVDALRGKVDVLGRLEKVRSSDAGPLAEQCSQLVGKALSADRYDVARPAAGLAVVLARRVGDQAMVQAATARQQDVNAIGAAYEQSRQALATLASEPNNTSAYLAAGRFYCFFRREWEKGLPLLASCSDKALKALAETETSNPSEPARQVGVADGWWDWSQKEQGVARRNLQAHAAEWYKKALPSVTGLAKLKAEARLAAVSDGLADPSACVRVLTFASPEALQAFWCKDPRSWRVVNGELIGEGRTTFHTSALTYNKYFSEITQVTIRGKIASPGNTNFRFAVGDINAILNWEREKQNLYWNGPEESKQEGHALSAGEWHTIVIEQKDSEAVVSVDGKEKYRAKAQLAGTVTVYPMQSVIRIAEMKIVGTVDPTRKVQGPSCGEVH